MSEQVKRYDAVHIRYEDNNIRYGEGCEVEVVTAADYEREVRIAIAAGQRMQDERDALSAEAEALRAENARLRQAMQRLVTTHCAASMKSHATDAELEQYLAVGIAQLEAEHDKLADELAAIKQAKP